MYALFVADVQETESNELNSISEKFLSPMRKNGDQTEEARRLSLGCWQIDLGRNYPVLTLLSRRANQNNISYHILFSETEFNWHSQKPETKDLSLDSGEYDNNFIS